MTTHTDAVIAPLRARIDRQDREIAQLRTVIASVLRRIEHPGYAIERVEQLVGLTVRDLRAALAQEEADGG